MRQLVGSCNGCGLCCQILVLPVPNDHCVRRDYDLLLVPRLKDYSARTVQYFVARAIIIGKRNVIVPIDSQDKTPFRYGLYNGNPVVYINSRCRLLSLENNCIVHGTPLQPVVCVEYPTVSDDLSIVADKCGYHFVEEVVAE